MIDVHDIERCVGCGACVDACPHGALAMVPDPEGFLRPQVNTTLCVDCGLCENVCQIGRFSGSTSETNPWQTSVASMYGAVALEQNVTARSSSGGVFYLLASEVIRCGGVVYGAAYGTPSGDSEKAVSPVESPTASPVDLEVRHVRVTDQDGLAALQGSKYIQSRTAGIFAQVRDDLAADRRVLFSGTPCQVAALKLFLGDTRTGLLTVDFICHGVPSPGLWREYLAFVKKETGRNVDWVTLRDKRKVTDRFHSCLKLIDRKPPYRPTEIYDKAIANLWIKIFLSNMAMRPSCHSCAFASSQRVSDITLADFWGGEKTHKALFDLGRGVSLVMCGTPRGEEAIKSILPQTVWEKAVEEDIRQPRLHSPAAASPRRDAFWADKARYGFGRKLAGKYLDYGFWQIIRRRLRAAFGAGRKKAVNV